MSNTQESAALSASSAISLKLMSFFRRPLSLAIRLTLFISMVAIIAFFAFTAFIISSIEDHFAQQDIADLERMSAKFQEVLNTQQSDKKTIRELRNITSSYLDAAVILSDTNGKILFSSGNSKDLINYLEQDNLLLRELPQKVFIVNAKSIERASQSDEQIDDPVSTDTAEIVAAEIDADAPQAISDNTQAVSASTARATSSDANTPASAAATAAVGTAPTAADGAATAAVDGAGEAAGGVGAAAGGAGAAEAEVKAADATVISSTAGASTSETAGLVGHGSHVHAAPKGRAEKHSYRVIAAQGKTSFMGNEGGYILLSALSINFHTSYIEILKQDLLFIAACMSLLIVAVVMIAVHKGHDPLRRVSEDIKNITSDNLDTRLDPKQVPAELTQLVVSFNGMLEKIEDVFNRQANFSADLAHEIRTPITNLLTQTEIALSQNRTCTELREVLYSNLEEYGRMSKMVGDMLFLAQVTDAKQMPHPILFDVCIEVKKVFEFFEALAEDRNVTLQMHHNSCAVTNLVCLMNSSGSSSGENESVGGYTHIPLSPVIIEGDQLMFRRAMSNLVSNAMRYTPTHGVIRVDIDESDEMCTVTVANPGKPIPPEHLPRLFDRFYRIDPSRQRKSESSGSGIGLAIVKSIAEAHNGKVSVESDEISTRFILHLPRRLHIKA